jgi:hypothetical protein
MCRVGQNCIYTPYLTVYLVISLPTIPYIHRIYMVLANPNHVALWLKVTGKGTAESRPRRTGRFALRERRHTGLFDAFSALLVFRTTLKPAS